MNAFACFYTTFWELLDPCCLCWNLCWLLFTIHKQLESLRSKCVGFSSLNLAPCIGLESDGFDAAFLPYNLGLLLFALPTSWDTTAWPFRQPMTTWKRGGPSYTPTSGSGGSWENMRQRYPHVPPHDRTAAVTPSMEGTMLPLRLASSESTTGSWRQVWPISHF